MLPLQQRRGNANRGRTPSANGDTVFELDGYAVFAKMSERSAHLGDLQCMGFPPAACERALQLTNNSLDRAIDWLLSNPAEAAAVASGSDSYTNIFSIGFEESLVRRALEQAGGYEDLAISLILNSEVSVRATQRAPKHNSSPSAAHTAVRAGCSAAEQPLAKR